MSRRVWLPRALWLALSLLLVFGCESIAGIEDRVYDPQNQVSEACAKYCDTVMENCTGTNTVYTMKELCHGVCAHLDPGDPLEPAGNTVACRTNQAVLAKTTNEPHLHCPRAGPGGAGVCGDNCESYCDLFAKACGPEIADREECVRKCAAFDDVPRFDVVADHEGDTVQCRLVHVSSAVVLPEPHCGHSRFVATEWCFEPPDAEPECEDYCRIVMVACTGDVAQYESLEQCLDVCAALEPGLNADRVENTVGCRKYHSYSSIFDWETHCSHAGPSGDGHCGPATQPSTGSTGNCEAYCRLLEAACSTEFSSRYADQSACIADCVDVEGAGPDSKYSVTTAAGPTLQCRFLELSRAFEDSAHCTGAVGGAPCE